MIHPDISGEITTGLLQWFLRSRNPVAQRDEKSGMCWLSYSRQYTWAIVAMFAISTIFLVGSMMVFYREAVPFLLTSSIFGLMWFGFAYALYDIFFVRIGFSDAAIVRHSFGGTNTILWSSITKIEYSDILHWFVFRIMGHRPLRVSIYRNGLATFCQCAARGLNGNSASGALYLLYEKAKGNSLRVKNLL